jgi:ATP-dependent protease HslVU (ClpYQ) peptidase subunit
MTTIAFRGRILAADTQLTWDDNTKTLCRKLYPQPGKGCIAFAGDTADEWYFKQWWLAGENIATWDYEHGQKKPNFDALYIDQWKDVWYYTDGPAKIAIEHEFFAIGSGAPIAMVAMHMGMSAKEAISFTSEISTTTNNLIDTYDVQTGTIKLSKWPKYENTRLRL